MANPFENSSDELVVLLEFQSNWAIDAETSLAFASAVLSVIRAEVGTEAVIELQRAGTGSKWFGFRFIDVAALVGVALAIETSAMTEGTILNRAIGEVDDIARVASLVIKPGHDEPKTIHREQIAVLLRRDQQQIPPVGDGGDKGESDPSAYSLEKPTRWLGRFEHRDGEQKFVVGECVEYFCRFDDSAEEIQLPTHTPVGLIASRLVSSAIAHGQIILLRAEDLVENWEKDWREDTTAGDAEPVRAGGYFRLLADGAATFSTFAGPNFRTTSEPVEAGPFDAGQRLIADFRLVASRDGQLEPRFHDIWLEEQFIEQERQSFEMARRAMADSLDDADG